MTRTLLFLLFAARLTAQSVTPTCPTGVEPAETCLSACITCNFNGYFGSTAGWAASSVPSFCSDIQNDQWIGFIASATNATFTATPSNCLNGNGVQMALYHACGQPYIACDDGETGNGNTPASITATLIPGNEYFLLIDGYGGDQCDFTLAVNPASAVQAPAVGPVGAVAGADSVCAGTTVTYSVPPVGGAGAYIWTAPPGVLINGLPSPASLASPAGHSVELTFGNQGGEVCVHALNACNSGDTVCKFVAIKTIPPTILPPVVICQENAPYELPWGTNISTSGNYTHTYSAVSGCDSTVSVSVTVLAPRAAISATATTLNCIEPSILLTAAASPIGSLFIWTKLDGTLLAGNVNAIEVLEADTIILTTTQAQGGVSCSAADTIIIDANFSLPTATAATSGMLACQQPTVQLLGSSTTSGATFAWTGPNGFSATLPSPTVYIPGSYTLVVTHPSSHCTATDSTEVLADSLLPTMTVIPDGTLTCAPIPVVLSTMTSASLPAFTWAGPGGFSSNESAPSVFSPGLYMVTVTDGVTGCMAANAAEVINQTIPFTVTTVGDTLTCTNPTGQLHVVTSSSNPVFAWSGPNGFVSLQPNPVVSAAGNYTVTVTDTITTCTMVRPVLVVADNLPPGVAAVGGVLDCQGSPLTLQGSSPTPGVTFLWIWSSDSSALANPMVTLPGLYTLIVTASNGCTSMATTEVEAPQIPVIASVQVSNDQNGQGVGTINLTVSGATDYTVTWYLNGQFFADTPNLTNLMMGTYVAVVSGAESCADTASVQVDNIVPTAEPATALLWEVMPNPAVNFLDVRFRGMTWPDARLNLFDMLGRKVADGNMTNGTALRLDVKTLPVGLYQLVIHDGKQTVARSVVIQR